MNIKIEENERMDTIGFGNLRLIQKPEDFCYGVDAVVLSDFVNAKEGDRIIDLGTGTGIIPLILSHKTQASQIYGVEVQEESYERACRNVILNNLDARVKILNCNVKTLPDEIGLFQVVISNPPYIQGLAGLKNSNEAKTIARHETLANLEDFICCASKLLQDKGDFYMVHRPSRLVDICCICRKYKLEPKEMRFVSPNTQKSPNIFLIHCVKNGGKQLKLLEPLYVYDKEGEYTKELLKIYEKTR